MQTHLPLKQNLETLRELRRKAFMKILDAREYEEENDPTIDLDELETSAGITRATKLFEILDDAVLEVRTLLLTEFPDIDMTTIY